MLRFPLRARKSGLVSGFAMALSLASGAAVVTAAIPATAQAQDYSKKFREVYGKMAEIVNAETKDWNAAKAMLPELTGLVTNDDEKYAAGQLILQVGNGLEDPALQRQGLEMSIESGKVPADKLGLFSWFAGNLAYNDGDYAVARKYLEGSVAAGYTENDPTQLIAQTYMEEGNVQGGLDFLKGAATARMAAGQPVEEKWLVLGLKRSYDEKLSDYALDFATMLVANYPTEKNWLYAVQTVSATNTFEPEAQLDLLRLQRVAGALKERYEYFEYVDIAGPSKMGAEVEGLLDEGVAAGVIATTDTLYTDYYGEAKRRGAGDRAETPGLVGEARASITGKTAQGVGDSFFSFGAFAEAEDMYQVALEKGVENPMMVTTRLGIAQARQGKWEEARATFAKIEGPRAPIARLWTAWIDGQAN